MDRMGGLWAAMPRLGGLTMVFAIAALGLPGLGNFVGEFLVLWGTLERSIAFAAVAAVGLVFAVVYALALVQRPFHGPAADGPQRDLSPAGTIGLAAMALGIVWLGLFPQTVLATAAPALDALQRAAAGTLSAGLAR
jgi:NADH-quinone oxidoreductase subunit M